MWLRPRPRNEIMANLTHVFNPTTTNEFVFTFARYINPSTLANPAAVSRATFGITRPTDCLATPLTRSRTSRVRGVELSRTSAEFSFDGGFKRGGFGATKRDPSLYDNFTKVIGSHTLKAGFYWDTSENIQSSCGYGSPMALGLRQRHLHRRVGPEQLRQRGCRLPARPHCGTISSRVRSP